MKEHTLTNGRKVFLRPVKFGLLRKLVDADGPERMGLLAEVLERCVVNQDGSPVFQSGDVDDLDAQEVDDLASHVLGKADEKKD